MAMLVTQIAAAAAVLSWTVAEWITKGKPSVLGAISGAVAGLVAITPAAGFVLPGSALLIGLLSGAVCFWAATALKHMLGYDDSLDAFGVHGVGGIVGALLTGFLAFGALTADAKNPDGVVIGGMALFMNQVIAVGATIIFSAVATFILLKIVDAVIGLRVTDEEEREGLDVVLHGERLG
jgi:Amt family ammonium transporter